MKKISNIILSSVLVLLTACGSGGGSSVSVSTLPTIVTNPTVDPEQTNTNSEDIKFPKDVIDKFKKMDDIDVYNKLHYPKSGPYDMDTKISSRSLKSIYYPGSLYYDAGLYVNSDDKFYIRLSLLNKNELIPREYRNYVYNDLSFYATEAQNDFKIDNDGIVYGLYDVESKMYDCDIPLYQGGDIIGTTRGKGAIYYDMIRSKKIRSTISDEDMINGNPELKAVDRTRAEIAFVGNSIGLSYFDFGWWKVDYELKDVDNNTVIDKVGTGVFYLMDTTESTLNPGLLADQNISFEGKTYAKLENSEKSELISGKARLDIIGNSEDNIHNAKLSLEFDNWYDFTYYPNSKTAYGSEEFEVKKGKDYKDNGFVYDTSKTKGASSDIRRINDEIGGNYFYSQYDWELVGTVGAKRINE